jgi:hypothetical protein
VRRALAALLCATAAGAIVSVLANWRGAVATDESGLPSTGHSSARGAARQHPSDAVIRPIGDGGRRLLSAFEPDPDDPKVVPLDQAAAGGPLRLGVDV